MRPAHGPAVGIVSALLPSALGVYSKAVSAGLTAAAGGLATAEAAGKITGSAIAFIVLTALGAAFAALATRNAPTPPPEPVEEV